MTVTTVTVRRAQGRDIGATAALNEGVQRLHVAARPDHFVPTSRAALEAELAQAPYLGARLWWEIDQIGVDPALRERGVARALVDTIARDAADAGVASLELTCWAFNAEARSAFESSGSP
jgi:GNAT superfamily N-acetyltransferase